MVATTNAVAKIAAVVAGLGLVAMSFASFAPAAKALTADEIAAQIAALNAQLAALGGSSASATFSMDLTLGSTGSDVTALQNWLISKGYSIPAGATGYFGAQTQAALAAYQAANGISPAAGYFGPITRAKVNAAGGSTSGGNDDDSSSGDLSGGAGSIDDATFLSGINNEEVGEDEEDVEVIGLEIEADEGSDLEFTAVRVIFNEGTAGSDFEDYASEVSVWFDGEEVARLDADEFNDDNDWTKTISLDDGAIVAAGEMGDLSVAVSGISNLDSGDSGDTWTAEIDQVRFRDADGATVSEDTTGDIGATRTFSFEVFATAADVELKISEDDEEVNDARTIEVDATADTDNVPVLSFSLEAEGDSDLEIKNFAVSVTVTGASNTDDVLSGLNLWIDGEDVATADTESAAGSDETYNFDDVDYTLSAGDTVSAELRADFLSIADNLDEGDTISFAVTENETDLGTLVDVEDETGEQLVDADITGSASSGAFELRSKGIMVTFVSASESVAVDDGADDDTGTFVIVFNAEAFGDTIYVSKTATATTASTVADATLTTGNLYLVEDSGTATTDDLADLVTFSTSGGASDGTNNLVLQDGEDSDITLTVTQTNDSAEDDGLYRMLLKSVGWALTDTTTWNVYDFNLEDFKTDPLSLN